MNRWHDAVSRRMVLGRTVAGLPPFLVAACATGNTTRGVVETYFQAVRARNPESVAALFAADASYADVTFAFEITGRDAIRGMFVSMFAGISRSTLHINTLVAEGSHAIAEWELTGEHTGPLLGARATGRSVRVRAVSILEVGSGRITRVRDYTDRFHLEAQLR